MWICLFRWGVVLQKILLVGAWVFGVIFIITSLGAFLEEGVVAGLLMLVGGVLLLPPVKRLILGKNTNLSSGKITAVGSILVFISFFLATLGDDTNSAPVVTNSVETKEDIVAKKDNTKVDTPVEIKPVVEPRPTTEVVKEKEPIEVAAIPVENKPIIEPEPTIEKAKVDKPVEVIEETPSKPSVTEKRQDIDPIKARAILEEVDQEVRAAKGFNLEDKAAIARKSRRMIALTKDTTPFGKERDRIGMFCSMAPTEALLYWYEVMSTRTDPQRVKELLKNYQESKKTCLDAIKDFENS